MKWLWALPFCFFIVIGISIVTLHISWWVVGDWEKYYDKEP